jgi:hypothetical protein
MARFGAKDFLVEFQRREPIADNQVRHKLIFSTHCLLLSWIISFDPDYG